MSEPPSAAATAAVAAVSSSTAASAELPTSLALSPSATAPLAGAPTDVELRAALGVSSTSAVSSSPRASARRAPAAATSSSAADELDDDRVAAELGGRSSLRRWATLIGAVLLVLAVGATFVLGHLNGQRYVLLCGADHVTAQQGRSFPPWGESRLEGLQWKPIAIPPAAECRDREAGSEAELAGWYLSLLVDQATARLTARKVVDVDLAAAQLEQALLLARAPERREQRRDIARLLGDVEYWRAVEKLRVASDSLADAARQFEEAALKQPRHVTDAPARAQQLRRLLEELAGRMAPPPGPGTAPEPLAPSAGTALPAPPVAPSTPLDDPSVAPTLSPVAPPDAGPDAAPDGGPAVLPDAAPPSGGVLL
jgi:hypothetical protein